MCEHFSRSTRTSIFLLLKVYLLSYLGKPLLRGPNSDVTLAVAFVLVSTTSMNPRALSHSRQCLTHAPRMGLQPVHCTFTSFTERRTRQPMPRIPTA